MSHVNPSDDTLRKILLEANTIAIVGASSNPERPANGIMKRLLKAGYRVIPVNPGETEVLGQRSYGSLREIPETIDIVDVFRRSEDTPAIADDAVALQGKVLWLQLGITNEEAARRAEAAGLTVVMDKCIGATHLALDIPAKQQIPIEQRGTKMRIVVFGAAGKAGSRIVKEAASRGHQVTAVARQGEQLKDLPGGVMTQVGDVTSGSSVRQIAPAADVIVVAVGGADNTIWRRAAQTLAETLPTIPNAPRVLHMGGGASLLDADGRRFLDSPHLPEAFRAPAGGQADALDFYRSLPPTTLRWTYASPPPVNFSPGVRTGHYRTGADHPVTDVHGQSAISYEDFAMALVDEIERPHFANQRFTVGY